MDTEGIYIGCGVGPLCYHQLAMLDNWCAQECLTLQAFESIQCPRFYVS